mgnify:CR=1 FL=1
MEKIKLEDESGDRFYFTQVPNYILNHSTAIAQALYLQLKRLAGENGIAYPSSKNLRKKLGISQPTLRKELEYLLEKKLIKYKGMKEIETNGGKQKIKTYSIVDIWPLNINYYQRRGEKIDTPKPQRGEKIGTQGVKARGEKIGNKEEPREEEPSFKKNHLSVASDNGKVIAEIIYLFKEVNPLIGKQYGSPPQRRAVERMLKVFGREKLENYIKVLPAVNAKPYWPKSTTPCQLENNLPIYKAKSDEDKSKGRASNVAIII